MYKPVLQQIPFGARFGFVFTDQKMMLPKRRFWKDEQMMKSGFSTDFSMVRRPKRVLTPLKSASNIRADPEIPDYKMLIRAGNVV
jgi:hypothetical protein